MLSRVSERERERERETKESHDYFDTDLMVVFNGFGLINMPCVASLCFDESSQTFWWCLDMPRLGCAHFVFGYSVVVPFSIRALCCH